MRSRREAIRLVPIPLWDMEWWFIKNIKIESNRIVEDGEECYNLLKEGRENTLPVKNRKCIIKSGCMGECLDE